jgi:ABC-type multidrug transport system fused ATPase/permease subunit
MAMMGGGRPGGGGGSRSGRGRVGFGASGGPGRRHGGSMPSDDTPPLKITNRRMLAWFYRNLAPHWPKVTLGVAAMFGGTAAGLYVPLILKKIFDQVIELKDTGPLLGLIVQFLVFTILTQVFNAARTNVMHLLGQRFVYEVRMQCYRHLMTLSLNYFERQRSGDIMSRISNDVDAVEHMVVHGSDDIISNSLHILGAVGILFYLDWRMALVALAPLPIFISCIWVFAHVIRPLFEGIRRELGEINAKLQERLGGIRVIKAFAREEAEVEFFDESSHAYWRMNAKSIWMWSTFFPALSLITSCGLVVMIWYGARLSATGSAAVTAGTLVAFMAYLRDFYRPIGQLAQVQNVINRSLASIARLFELLDEKPTVCDKPGAIELGHIEGRVEIDRVSFSYQNGQQVLSEISTVAEPGETIAIVGRSGAGKTSLVNLIARFYDPTAGCVRVDGHDLRDVAQSSLRRNIGMVLQETFLFNSTAKENILYARPDATDAQVIDAARRAHAHDFIEKLDDGYETIVGERGVRLSGGEKQRIAIARALLADPRILILDEATSMVDTEAEQIIQAALEELMKGRTTFIIAHRLSTVRNADKICVIEGGQIVEQDRHKTLMAKGGLYANMVNRQFQITEDWDLTDDPQPGMI